MGRKDFPKHWTLNSQASFAGSLIRRARQLSQTNLDHKAYVNLNESLARDSLLRIQSFIKTQLEESDNSARVILFEKPTTFVFTFPAIDNSKDSSSESIVFVVGKLEKRRQVEWPTMTINPTFVRSRSRNVKEQL